MKIETVDEAETLSKKIAIDISVGIGCLDASERMKIFFLNRLRQDISEVLNRDIEIKEYVAIERCVRCGKNLTEMGPFRDFVHYREDGTLCVRK